MAVDSQFQFGISAVPTGSWRLVAFLFLCDAERANHPSSLGSSPGVVLPQGVEMRGKGYVL